MADDHGYTMVVINSPPFKRWGWEIYCDGTPLPSRLYGKGFRAEHTARSAGNAALRELLSAFAREEGGLGPGDFRRIALSMPQAVEVVRSCRSEFRVRRKTFASLEGPNESIATVNLTPNQQASFMHATPKAFAPAPRAWGGVDRTNVMIAFVPEALLRPVLEAAWHNAASKSHSKKIKEPSLF